MSPHEKPPTPTGEKESQFSPELLFAGGVLCGALALHWYDEYTTSSALHVPDEISVVAIEDGRGVVGWE